MSRHNKVWYAAICMANRKRFKGRKLTKAHRKKISKGSKLAWVRKSKKEKNSYSRKVRRIVKAHWKTLSSKDRAKRGRKVSVGWTRKSRLEASSRKKAEWRNPARRKRHIRSLRRRSKDKDYLRKLRAAVGSISYRKAKSSRMSLIRNSLSKKKKEEWALAVVRACKSKPNNKEKCLDKMLRKNFPGEFKLNVKGGISIGGKVPDFVNVNGQKLLVELFGDYWHGRKMTGRSRKEEEDKKKECFSKYGFRTAIVWENELKNSDLVCEKIRKEMY